MRIIPDGIDSNLSRSSYLVRSVRATPHNAYKGSGRFKTKPPKPETVKTFEGMELIEMLLNQGKPEEAQKVFNRLKAQLEQSNG
jgi:hypothetical protein